MRVEQLGDGEPEIAIVGGIHGDEPCGPAAVERLIEERPEVLRPVKLVVANEAAIERDTRYVEADLNRVFPGHPEGDTLESRLAHELFTELRGCTVFSMHSTQSTPLPFAITDRVDGVMKALAPYLSIELIVETDGFGAGSLTTEFPDVIEVECGLQRSPEAAENAYRLCREFLVAVGALSGATEPRLDRELPVYRMARRIPKPRGETHEVFVENFSRVAAGEVFAATDGTELVAEESFYPILLSPYGYRKNFGFAGELAGRLDAESAV